MHAELYDNKPQMRKPQQSVVSDVQTRLHTLTIRSGDGQDKVIGAAPSWYCDLVIITQGSLRQFISKVNKKLLKYVTFQEIIDTFQCWNTDLHSITVMSFIKGPFLFTSQHIRNMTYVWNVH